MKQTHAMAALVVVLLFGATVRALAAESLAAPFDTDYTLIDLGSAPGVPANLNSLTFVPGDSNTLVLSGSGSNSAAKLYTIGLTRDLSHNITGFSGTAAFFADANGTSGGADGGLSFGPGGVLFYTSWPDNRLGEIKAGSTGPDKLLDLTAAGIASSVGTLVFVPSGFPGAGKFKIAEYTAPGNWYDATLTADGSGTFDVSTTFTVATGGGPEGIIYIAAGNADFAADSVLVSEYSANRVSAFTVDPNGDPQPASRRDFVTGLTGAAGAVADPLTGDFLFSTFGNGNRVLIVRGFLPLPTPTPTATATPTLTPTPTATPTPTEEAVRSYFLPKSLKLKLAGAGKDSLMVAGSFDDGNLPADLTQPVTIDVGGFSRTVTLTAKGPNAFAFKDATFSLTVKTHLKGSSRGSFKLKAGKTTLAGLIDPSGTIELHFHATGLPDALGVVTLTNGAFALGKTRGDLVAPAFFPSKASVAANDAKPDALSFSGGFGNAGATPSVLGDVHIALGDTFDQTIAGNTFTRKGNVFSHGEKGAGTALSVSLDFGRGIMKVKAKGIEVGTFAAVTADFVVDVGGGGLPVRTTVRLGGTGTKRVY